MKMCIMVYGCMDVWMYGCMYVWIYGCMDVWMYGFMDVWMYKCDVPLYVCMYFFLSFLRKVFHCFVLNLLGPEHLLYVQPSFVFFNSTGVTRLLNIALT